jgi:hypothetical protein
MTGDPKSGVFEGKEGSGLAQFLGNRQDAFQTTQQPINQLYNLKLREKQEQQAAEKRKRDALAKMSSYDSIFTQSEKELADMFEAGRELYTEIWSEGGDPESDPRWMQFMPKWNTTHSQNKSVKEYVDKIKQNLATGNYDEEYALAEIDKIMNAPTIGERFELTRQTDPLIPKVQLFKGANLFAVAPTEEVEDKGGRRVKTVTYDDAKLEENAKAYMLANPEQVEYYNRKKGNGRDIEVVTEEFKASLKPILKKQREVDSDIEVRKGGGLNVSIGGGTQNEKFNAVYANDPAISKVPQGVNNYIAIADYKTGSDLKPIEFQDASNVTTFMKVGSAQYLDMGEKKKEIIANMQAEEQRLEAEINEFRRKAVMGGGGLSTSDMRKIKAFENQKKELANSRAKIAKMPNEKGWYMVGVKGRRPTGEMTKPPEGDELVQGVSYEQDESGKYVEIFENVPDYAPISSIQGTVGSANLAKITAITGLDIAPEISKLQQSAPKQGATTSTTKPKSTESKQVPIASIKGLVGKKGYEGYTEKELIDYYTSQGYEIVK